MRRRSSRGAAAFVARGLTSSASRIRPKSPPLAYAHRFRTECARERLPKPADITARGAERRVGGPTASTDQAGHVVQAEAGHLHDRVPAPEDLRPLGAEEPL